MENKISFSKGFTLIELLIVISIIGLLASAVMVSFSISMKKSRDSERMQELKQIQTALRVYYDIHHEMPINRDEPNFYCDDQPNFLQELVDERLWPDNPKDPVGLGWKHYCYYDYGEREDSIYGEAGALLVAELESYNEKEGVPGSCRPSFFDEKKMKCNSIEKNRDYCLCTPYSPYW